MKKKEKNQKEMLSYKFEIFPTKEQKEYLIENQKACLTIFNIGLKIAISQYELPKKINRLHNIFSFTNYLSLLLNDYNFVNLPSKGFDALSIRNKVNKIKKNKEKYNFLNNFYSQSLNNMIYGNKGNLEHAFNKFFAKQSGFPKFKKKHQYKEISLYIPGNLFRINVEEKESFIVIPLTKGSTINKKIKIKIHRQIDGKIKNARISSNNTNKFFVSFATERNELIKKELKENKAIGIDFGIKYFATMSTGERIDNPKYYQNKEKQLKKLNKKKDKKAFKKCNTCKFIIPFKDKASHGIKNCPNCKTPLITGKNYLKLRHKVSKHNEKIKNQRKDFLQKQSSELIKNNNLIVIENLSMENMNRNKKLSKALSDTGWGGFVEMLQYKGKWSNCRVIKIDRFYPSSQICHCCGYRNKELKLSQRTWICPICKAELDRDFNAALNILSKYLSDILIQSVLSQNPCNINYVLNFLNTNKIGVALPDFKPVEKSTSGIKLEKSDFVRSNSRKQEMTPARERLLL
jgi:putative transposase